MGRFSGFTEKKREKMITLIMQRSGLIYPMKLAYMYYMEHLRINWELYWMSFKIYSGVIRESTSLYSSHVVLVKKKDGT